MPLEYRFTGVSRKLLDLRRTSTISSNRRSISRLRIPRIDAAQVDVLAPGQLRMEAGPTSSREPTRPVDACPP